MARDDEPKHWDTGKLAYIQADEGWTDERVYRLAPRYPFWKSEAEEMRYMRARQMCPLNEYRHMDMFAYLGEVVKVAEGIKPAVKGMPPIEVY